MLLYTFYPTIEKFYENVMCLLGRSAIYHLKAYVANFQNSHIFWSGCHGNATSPLIG